MKCKDYTLYIQYGQYLGKQQKHINQVQIEAYSGEHSLTDEQIDESKS